MIVAIPLFGSRVSPRCLFSETMIVARVEDGQITSRRRHSIKDLSEDALLDELVELGVDTLVCGGVDQVFIEDAGMCGVEVINNVAGEVEPVLEAFQQGRLVPGFGLGPAEDAETLCPVRLEISDVNCLECVERNCLEGAPCSRGEIPAAAFDAKRLKIAEIAAEVSAEDERKLCRVAELVHFALGMGYCRLGVAFCVEMFQEAEILCGVLKRFFEVVPVCCRVGSGPAPSGSEGRGHPCCNIAGQAEILNGIQTDLNVLVGLCVGCDIIFAEHSRAPSTTLFVKDRSLANNPVGALYSRYYLDKIVPEIKSNVIQGGP